MWGYKYVAFKGHLKEQQNVSPISENGTLRVNLKRTVPRSLKFIRRRMVDDYGSAECGYTL